MYRVIALISCAVVRAVDTESMSRRFWLRDRASRRNSTPPSAPTGRCGAPARYTGTVRVGEQPLLPAEQPDAHVMPAHGIDRASRVASAGTRCCSITLRSRRRRAEPL